MNVYPLRRQTISLRPQSAPGVFTDESFGFIEESWCRPAVELFDIVNNPFEHKSWANDKDLRKGMKLPGDQEKPYNKPQLITADFPIVN